MLEQSYDMFALSSKIYNVKILELSEKEARVSFTLITNKISGPAFRDNQVNGVMILRPDKGQWKLYGQENESDLPGLAHAQGLADSQVDTPVGKYRPTGRPALRLEPGASGSCGQDVDRAIRHDRSLKRLGNSELPVRHHRSHQIRLAQIGATQVGPDHINPTQVSPE